ncbi:hypothetical protein H0H93_004378 [Arthromyces matolae]|nr:hypothetical protein H0H93_004378 [Arthromyces matolae]
MKLTFKPTVIFSATAATYLLSSFGITHAMALPLTGATAPVVHNLIQPVIDPLDYFLNTEFEAEGNTLPQFASFGLIPRMMGGQTRIDLLREISQKSLQIKNLKTTRKEKLKGLLESLVQAAHRKMEEFVEKTSGVQQAVEFASTVLTQKQPEGLQNLASEVLGLFPKHGQGKEEGPGKQIEFQSVWKEFTKVEQDLKEAYKENMEMRTQLVDVWMSQRGNLSKDGRNQLQKKLEELDGHLLYETKGVVGATKTAADACHKTIQDAIKLNSKEIGEPEVAPEPQAKL